jgi:gas vesicle protein
MNTAGKVTIGILSGLAIGVATGILIAPSSGRKTRKKLIGKSKELTDRMAESLEDVKKAYNKKVEAYAGEGKHGIDSLKNTLKV